MRSWLPALALLLSLSAKAQHAHLAVPPKGSPQRVQLYGMVTDSLTGKPVYDCLVEYFGRDGQRSSISSTNSDGRYAMFVPAGVPFELRIVKEGGYFDLRRAVRPIAAGTGQYRQDLVLQPMP
jgi:hypothetical protein